MDFVSTGCRQLDFLLGGGVKKGVLTEFYGPPGVGKTNVCLSTLYQCIRGGGVGIFVDTEGNFSLERLKQIAGEDYSLILEKTFLSEPTNFLEQKQVVEKVGEAEADLVVLDSASSLYRLELGDNPSEVNRALSKQLGVLSELARKKNTAVVLSNQVYTNIETDEIVAVGGSIFEYMCKIIVELKRTGDSREAVLKKHPWKRDGEKVSFALGPRGIC